MIPHDNPRPFDLSTQVYYAILNDKGVVINCGHCPYFMVELQHPGEAVERIVISHQFADLGGQSPHMVQPGHRFTRRNERHVLI